MAALSIKQFSGIAPKIPARYLSDSQAQIALNCPIWTGSLAPLPDLGETVATLTKGGAPKTIYRFGQEDPNDSNFWFSWDSYVDVCPSQIAQDVSEWTFFSGDGKPKATYNAIALSGTDYPTLSRPLGLPAAETAAQVNVVAKSGEELPAEVVLAKETVDSIIADGGIGVSFVADLDADYTTATLADNAALTIAAAISSIDGVSGFADSDGSVTITTDDTGADISIYVRYQIGTDPDTSATFTYDTSQFDLTAVGTADTLPAIRLTEFEIGSIAVGDLITVATGALESEVNHIDAVGFSGNQNAQGVADFINNQLSSLQTPPVIAEAHGTLVVLTGTSDTPIYYKRSSAAYPDSLITSYSAKGSEAASPARIYITSDEFENLKNSWIALTVNTKDYFFQVEQNAIPARLVELSQYGVNVEVVGSNPVIIISTVAIGTGATIRARVGSYPSEPVFASTFGASTTSDLASQETRVYAYTWVNKESGFEMEGAPSPASSSVDVYPDQVVTISNFASVPSDDYIVTHRRIYRSTSGVFLFVGEMEASASQFTDDVLPEALGEEMPSLDYAEPPEDLKGLINLPNGMMAGFLGRDVYFSEPYRPYAWPEKYIQSIDYPVVGFGRMDTTLAVLTTGTPYLIQGSHPENTAVVKSDLEQACVSKQSIVSFGGGVLYAAPDGLMLLSSGGSRIVTEDFFNFKQWQAYFKPESIHAYQHDNQYIAFYDNGVNQGGFIYDIRSNTFITHDIYVECAFHDVVTDKLYVANSDGEISIWGAGLPKAYVWKSKKFTLPQIAGFSCAQLEAENYPMTFSILSDGNLIHTKTVENREAFRLPAVMGRDWEVQIEGEHEVFSVSVAQSMSELANG